MPDQHPRPAAVAHVLEQPPVGRSLLAAPRAHLVIDLLLGHSPSAARGFRLTVGQLSGDVPHCF